MQSFIMNSHEVFIHIHQGCFAGTGAIVRLPQCQWSKPDGYGKISQCLTTTKHSKSVTVCIYLGIYCNLGHEVISTFHIKQCDFTYQCPNLSQTMLVKLARVHHIKYFSCWFCVLYGMSSGVIMPYKSLGIIYIGVKTDSLKIYRVRIGKQYWSNSFRV